MTTFVWIIKAMKKLINYLPLILLFTASCTSPNNGEQPRNNISEPATITKDQQQVTIPWVDPSLFPPTKGC